MGLIVAIILLLSPYTFQQAFTQGVPEIWEIPRIQLSYWFIPVRSHLWQVISSRDLEFLWKSEVMAWRQQFMFVKTPGECHVMIRASSKSINYFWYVVKSWSSFMMSTLWQKNLDSECKNILKRYKCTNILTCGV